MHALMPATAPDSVTYQHEVAIQLRFRTIQSASSALPILDGRFAIDLPPYTVRYLGGPIPPSAEVLLSGEEVQRGIHGRLTRSVENFSHIHQRLTSIFGSTGRIFYSLYLWFVIRCHAHIDFILSCLQTPRVDCHGALRNKSPPPSNTEGMGVTSHPYCRPHIRKALATNLLN